MSQHSSLKSASRITARRNVMKRFERIDVLRARGKWKAGDRATGLPKPWEDRIGEWTLMLSKDGTVKNDSVPCDRQRILVVDDEQIIQRLFEMILSWELPGRQIDVASNGAEAVRAFTSGHHAVLLMDLHMPVMDGQAAFCEIQRTCEARNWQMPSVVFCTGFAPPASLKDVLSKSSVHCLLSKPVSNETLVEAVKQRLTK
jgi:small basic protein (TIGR04137 family)